MTAKILVVDDERDLERLICQKFRKNIRGKYFEFVYASNGVEALKKLQEEAPIDMVLTDINMPGLDGLSLLTKINEIDPTIKTVIMSAYGDMSKIRTAMNRGAFDFLTKPLDFQDLEITIKRRLEHVRELKENQRYRQEKEKSLQQSEKYAKEQAEQLQKALEELQRTQAKLVQSEKMSSLGQLVAGVAHEINNPVNFIYGNLSHANDYTQNLLNLLNLYNQHYPNPSPEIKAEIEAIDLEFLIEDLPRLLGSMKLGSDRIRDIVRSLRNFSRVDESEMKPVDIHEGIDSTLLILHNRLKAKSDQPAIQVIKDYGNLPLVECYAGQLNQVFMNLITNALDALEMGNETGVKMPLTSTEELSWLNTQCPLALALCPVPTIRITTEVINRDWVGIRIADNGSGMSEEVRSRLFNTFFTTKPVGKGTGLGLSISHQIVSEKHGGQLRCISAPGEGSEFIIEIPVRQSIGQHALLQQVG